METKSFYEGDLSLYTGFDHPKGWSRPLIRQFLDKEFKRHPAIAPILRRDPPVFTSNHAPFFVMDKGSMRQGERGSWDAGMRRLAGRGDRERGGRGEG
jgi:hypothetical protein